jgi:hypothetical protein
MKRNVIDVPRLDDIPRLNEMRAFDLPVLFQTEWKPWEHKKAPGYSLSCLSDIVWCFTLYGCLEWQEVRSLLTGWLVGLVAE